MVNGNGQLVHLFYSFMLLWDADATFILLDLDHFCIHLFCLHSVWKCKKNIGYIWKWDKGRDEARGNHSWLQNICFSAHTFTLIYVYKHVKSKKGNTVEWNKWRGDGDGDDDGSNNNNAYTAHHNGYGMKSFIHPSMDSTTNSCLSKYTHTHTHTSSAFPSRSKSSLIHSFSFNNKSSSTYTVPRRMCDAFTQQFKAIATKRHTHAHVLHRDHCHRYRRRRSTFISHLAFQRTQHAVVASLCDPP